MKLSRKARKIKGFKPGKGSYNCFTTFKKGKREACCDRKIKCSLGTPDLSCYAVS